MTETQGSSFDIEELKELYQSSPLVKRVLDEFSKPDYYEQTTTVVHDLYMQLWESGDRVPERDLIHVMKRFALYRYGTFKTGRRGHRSRIEWKYSPFTLGAVVRGVQPVQENAIVAPQEDGDEERGESPANSRAIDHRYRLRADWIVDFNLPADLTAWEAARLGEFIKTLPFGAPATQPINFGDLSMYKAEQ
jgi:hypothetical protein